MPCTRCGEKWIAAAYEREREAKAQLTVAEAQIQIAEAEVEVARLEKQAELERQAAYTEEYFRDKELDVQREAVAAINPSIQTIITSGDGDGYGALVGLDKVLSALGG